MAEPKQKDALDIAIDFFFGALFADLAYGLTFLRTSGRWLWTWNTSLIVLFAITLIAGSLAALLADPAYGRNRLAGGESDPLDALRHRLCVARVALPFVNGKRPRASNASPERPR
jgi:hypothetical protein